MKEKKLAWLLILSLVLTIGSIHVLVVYTYFYHSITGRPEAVDGRMDLTAISPADGKVYLDGEWELYWDQLIVSEPEPLSSPDLVIKVPISWSNYEINGEPLSAGGVASYKLTLTGLEYDHALSLYIPDFGGAYRVFIDGELTSVSGTVSRNMDEIFTVPKAKLFPVTLSPGKAHSVVIEVATTRFSGLYMTPVLSDYNQTVRGNSSRSAIQLILFGTALFSLTVLFMLYIATPRQKLYSLWLPIMTLFVILRLMLTSEFYSFWQPIFFFNLSYESTNELMYLATFALKYLLIFLFQEQCGITFSRKEKIGFLAYYAVLYLIYMFTPDAIYNQYLSVLLPLLTYVLDLYLFAKIYGERHLLRKHDILVFWSGLLVMAGLSIDSYYLNGKIYANMSLTLVYSFTLFSLIMSWIYSMRTAEIYTGLQWANSQLDRQKEYYEALSVQMNHIREIKHNIHHFAGAMSRLVEENRFDELRAFFTEYVQITHTEQLPVFCEHIVANSIIGYYYLRAREYEISFQSQGNIPRQCVMSDSDLCIVLGNALKNALEACQSMNSSDKMFISIELGVLRKQLLIRIENSYSGSLRMRADRFVSSKPGSHSGFGIRNIERVVTHYGGFIKIEHSERRFVLMAAVPEN